MLITNCPQCGKEIHYYPSWPRIYCSKKCAGQAHADEKRTSVKVVCEQCGKNFMRNPFEIAKVKHLFCSRTCFAAYLSKTQKGKQPPFVGTKFPERTKNGTIVKTCIQCGEEFRMKKSQDRRGNRQCCSKKCRAAWQSVNQIGKHNPAWRGGYDEYYGPNWHQQRRAARRRDQYTCQRCGTTEDALGRQLDVHHIQPFRTFRITRYLEANSLANLISLCAQCHLIIEHEQETRPNP